MASDSVTNIPISAQFISSNISRLMVCSGQDGIAGRRADAGVGFGDQLVIAEFLFGGIAPQILAHALVQRFGKGLGQTVSNALEGNGVVVVQLRHEFGFFFLGPDTGGDGKDADVVLDAAGFAVDEFR